MSSFNILLAKKQAELFNENNITYIDCLVRSNGLKSIWLGAYADLINLKEIEPIDKLPSDEKKILWETATEFSKGLLSKENNIELCKALYTLEYLLS